MWESNLHMRVITLQCVPCVQIIKDSGHIYETVHPTDLRIISLIKVVSRNF